MTTLDSTWALFFLSTQLYLLPNTLPDFTEGKQLIKKSNWYPVYLLFLFFYTFTLYVYSLM